MADKCPLCGNTHGFVCGTCCQCGFNHISCRFDWIKVDVERLPLGLREWLTERHAMYTRRYAANAEEISHG